MMKSAVLCGAMLFSVAATAESTSPPPPDTAMMTVEIEVDEQQGKARSEHSVYTLPLIGEHNWSKLTDERQSVHYAVEVARDNTDLQMPILAVNVVRKVFANRDGVDQSVRAALRVKRGTRALVSQLECTDGTTTSIYVTAK